MNNFMKGLVCLVLAGALFLLADYFKVDNFEGLF